MISGKQNMTASAALLMYDIVSVDHILTICGLNEKQCNTKGIHTKAALFTLTIPDIITCLIPF